MALPPKDKPPLNRRFIRPADRRPRQPHSEPGSFASSGSSPLIKALLIIGVAFALMFTLLLGYAFLIAKPNLPKISALVDYNPKTPLRIYTADKVLIGEFGEERRKVIPLNEIPVIMRNAVIATEDDRFYSHGGVDYIGVLRAGVANLRGHLAQGASTITMQVARNFFLSNEKTFSRKIYEILLAWEIESELSKDKILEIYMNQIFLGQRAFGFASAAQIYFGINLKDISIAQAAMLAGLPKAPSAYNPVTNYRRAKIRQEYILQRMYELGYITQEQYLKAKTEELHIRGLGNEFSTRADFPAEMVRQLLFSQYGEAIYSQGIDVYTTILKADQDAAYKAVRRGIFEYDLRHAYRGPEGFINLPEDPVKRQRAIDEALLAYPQLDDLQSGVVLEAKSKEMQVMISTGDVITLKGDALRLASASLTDNAQPKKRLRPGAVVRLLEVESGVWKLAQLPQVEAAFVSVNADNGAILSLVGGFDFRRNQFNHVTQALRQPGSSFKPFIYSAAMEKGFSPSTMVNDAPLSIGSMETGSSSWEPKNYDGKYDGMMRLRTALAKSKNLVSVRLIRAIGPSYAQDFIQRFGFDPEKHPPYLTMALGAGSVTPLQMATAYSVFANGGYRIDPYLIEKMVDSKGNVLFEAKPVRVGEDAPRVLDARTAFVMDSMLQEVTKTGTAASARAKLGRSDIAGKTGTTNDSHDAWFAGYNPKVVAIAWIGFDKPESLGDHETGGGLALPMWISYMGTALKGVPQISREAPAGVSQLDGDWYIPEFAPNGGVRELQ
ncbi:penicillin-binding protein 1A [Polynucleobacter sphagniphilus]|uniref:Penicillin-binding protein 1A n=2 Tax=Polynucleobacter sphagniphilus TaxID=1743169 RepID=A0AA43S534_9BURK|nr:penicillin-binding protein 1A [Polynucleobacter sphagniphilus]MDF9789058.1 penicillin-binding protein 1A [Polynucleobacter sphagniphilus]MDH6241999.1 penicillin-binding protein 1A [Polynucleobacter sphagniphilus]MDH6249114.1 penicillin-binding protein 1A [Polynucleobacter sphagniphilus]MDH6299082.1 penicillin-binding protein 1A [Polynucleobacter sphagniphilus]MDH6302456.1 penicillin-binding protein 1A [Polynucleobacter sphagniphilus]